MKKKLLSAFLALTLVFGSVSGIIPVRTVAAERDENSVIIEENDIPLRLYYDEEASHGVAQGYDDVDVSFGSGDANIAAHPNDDWERWSIPLGNGYFGANLFGRTGTERIQLTEKTLANPYRIKSDSKNTDGLNNFSETYIDFGHTSGVTNYSRELDLKTAVSTVSYKYNNVTYTREYFTSYPDNAMVIKLDASASGALGFVLRPTVPYEQEYMNVAGDNGGKTGTVTSSVSGGVGEIVLSGKLEYYDIDFFGLYKVYTEGGSVTATTCTNANGETDGTLTVSGATTAYIIITLGTDYELSTETFTESRTNKPTFSTTLEDAEAKVRGYMSALEAKTSGKSLDDAYALLKNNHLADYQELFGRVTLDLGCEESDFALTTDELLTNYKNGSGSRYLETLYFQYGRYLLIASSRSGALPANLQGTWNRYNHAPWSSGYWHNINVQMNYWPAFSTNIAETFEAYAEYNAAYMTKASSGATSIINQYNPSVLGNDGGNGWSIATGGYVYDVYGSESIGNLGFTTQLFWEYYEYSGDEAILENIVYPVLVGAARFITKMVKEDADGNYLAIYTDSPEQYVGGVWYYTTGTTYAQSFAYQNNYNMLLAAKKLGIDFSDTTHEDYAIIKTVLDQIEKYDPIVVGLSGQVKEFREEEYYGDLGEYDHRHISQLVGLYPANVINGTTPAWLDAAKYSLTERGDKATGWGVAHRLNLWARVQNGERAHDLLEQLLSVNTATNLWDLHPPFQIDGNLGGTAGISEMLLQSHAGYIEPLSAIPAAWTEGSYTGLVARGNFEVSAAWSGGVATTFNILSKSGGSVSVKYDGIDKANLYTADGEKVSYTAEGGIITFDTEAGKTYIISGFTKCEKPDAPTSLTVETDVLKDSTLTWGASADAVYYNVYVAKDSAPGYTLLATTRSTAYVYERPELENARLTFAVTAVNALGVESERVLAYRNPDDISPEINSLSASVISGELQVAINANEYTSKYRLYSKELATSDWSLVEESSYPIIINATYNSTYKYGVSVVSYFGDESEVKEIVSYNQSLDTVEYTPSNIFAGIDMLPSNEGYSYKHASAAVGDYGKLTDGDFSTSTGRFSTKASATDVLEATVSLPTTFLLGELQLYDFRAASGTALYVGSHIKVEAAIDGVWTTVKEYNSNAEIVPLRKSGANGSYIGIDLSLVRAQQIRIRIDSPIYDTEQRSISLNEIQCTGMALNTGMAYNENILLGKTIALTPDCNTWEATGGNSNGVAGLTDGTYRYSENPLLWRTWYNKDYVKFDGTIDLCGEAVLNELRLFHYMGDWNSIGPNLQIYYYYDGAWTLLHDLTFESSTEANVYIRSGKIDTDTAEQWLTLDMQGVRAEKIRIYMPAKTSNAYGMHEITLSGYYEPDGSTYSSNVFSGYEFVPTAAAAAKIWGTNTYDKLTDGSDTDTTRFATSGTSSFVDATLSFDGNLASLDTLTVDYGKYTQARSGAGLVIQVLNESGEWTDALNLTYDTAYQEEVTYELGGVSGYAVRLYVPGVYPTATGTLTAGDCIVIMEIKCSGALTPTDKEYKDNMLLGKSPIYTNTNGTITSNTNGVYGFDKLTDGSMELHTGRFALNALAGNYATVTYDLGGDALLGTLKIWDHVDGKTVARSNETTIELLVDGVWVKYLDAQPLWTNTADTVVSGNTRCVSFDLSGHLATQIRITFKNTHSDYKDGVTFYEISLSGYTENREYEYKDDVFYGFEFAPTDSTAAANIWSPNTYDNITDDGAINDSSSRFATANGHTADGTLDFDGQVAMLYTLTVNFDPYTKTRCGQDFNIYVYRNGEWTKVLSHVHTTPVLSETFDLGGVEAEKVRFTVSGKYSGGANADGQSGDCIIIYEMSCNGYMYTPEKEGMSEDENTNVLLGITNDKLSVSGATVHTGAAVKDLANAFDGSLSTRYAVMDASPYAYTLDIELNAVYPLYTLRIYPFFNSGEASRSDKTYVELYLDGAWIRVADGVEIMAAAAWTEIDLMGLKASKIRIGFANTTWSASASIYEIECTTGSSEAVDRSALLDAYRALDEVELSDAGFGVDAARDARVEELKALLQNTAATQSDIDSYVTVIDEAMAVYTETPEASLKTDTYGDFTSYNLTLGSDIGFNFYAALSGEGDADITETFPDATVLVEYVKYEDKTATVVREEVKISELNKNAERHVLTLNMAAAQMTDKVKIRIIFDGDNIGKLIEESVKDYADAIIANESGTYTDEDINLVKAMLNYGGLAQSYFGYNTESLANDGVDVSGLSGSTNEGVSTVTKTGDYSFTDIRPTSWTLSLEENVNIKVFFTSENIAGYTFTVTGPDGSVVGEVMPERVAEDTYRVCIEIPDIKYFDDACTLVIRQISSGNEITMRLNGVKYVENKLASGSTDESLKKLCEALRLYCALANSYGA